MHQLLVEWRHQRTKLLYKNDQEELLVRARVAGDIATLNSWNDVTDIDGTPHIMAGMGMNVVTKHAMEEHYQEKLTDEHDDFGKSFELQSDIDKYVKEQSEYVKSLPTHYEFLRDNVYNE